MNERIVNFASMICNLNNIFLILITCLAFTACNESGQAINEYPQLNGHVLNIDHNPGENISFELFNATVPSFFPSGKFNGELFTFLLAKGITAGDNAEIIELGLLIFEQNDSLHQVLIASPKNEKHKIVLSENFNDFSLDHPNIKHLIESWIKTNCPENSCKNVKWQNDFKARLKIQELLSKK